MFKVSAEPECLRWDYYGRFHIKISTKSLAPDRYSHPHGTAIFAQFTDGLTICNRKEPSPDERGYYPLLGVSLISTTDDSCPPLFVPGDDKPIPKSHLNYTGATYLVVDWRHKRAVPLTGCEGECVPEIALGSHVGAFWASAGQPPQSRPVAINPPLAKTPEMRQLYKDNMAKCKAWAAMHGDRVRFYDNKISDYPAWTKPFDKLSPIERNFLGKDMHYPARGTVTHEYLAVRPEDAPDAFTNMTT